MTQAAIPLFYWDAKGHPMGSDNVRFQVGNFGDLASKSIVNWLTQCDVKHADDQAGSPRLLAIGSILHRAVNGDIIWGSGLKGTAANLLDVSNLDVRAVRGPITYDFLRRRGIDVSKVSVLFDPGSLAASLPVAEGTAAVNRKRTLIIPHFRETSRFWKKHWRHRRAIVSTDCELETMIQTLRGADRVISSSLHGIIIAEALGIPSVWLRPLTQESLVKYYDYYYSTDRYDVPCFTSLKDALRSEPPPLPRLELDSMKATFPFDRLKDLTRTQTSPPHIQA